LRYSTGDTICSAGFEALEIVVPFNQNDTQDQIVAKSEKCPQLLRQWGMAYLLKIQTIRIKMIFLSIGQYLINSEGNNQVGKTHFKSSNRELI